MLFHRFLGQQVGDVVELSVLLGQEVAIAEVLDADILNAGVRRHPNKVLWVNIIYRRENDVEDPRQRSVPRSSAGFATMDGINAWLAQPDLGTKVQGLVDAMATVDASTSAEAAARRAGETASTMVGSFFRGVCAGERQRDSPWPEHEVGRLKS